MYRLIDLLGFSVSKALKALLDKLLRK